MGYFIDTRDVRFTVKKENFDRLVELTREMFEPERIKADAHGGVWEGGQRTKAWYSWVDTGKMYELLDAADIGGIFDMWGFEPTFDTSTGDLVSLYYDSKMGQEDLFLKQIAPVVEDGSYIEWRGEDSSFWRHNFRNGRMFVADGEVVYGEDYEVE